MFVRQPLGSCLAAVCVLSVVWQLLTLMLCVWLWQVTAACKKHGGFYLGSIGGPAAILAQNCIKKVEVLEFPELGRVTDTI